jgi:LacI family transcriptional regulator
MRDWLAQLPRPVGLMACYDIRAQQLLDMCRELELAVPEQVAVIGVDNDELLCNLCTPPLTSVIPDTHQTGYVAAQLLDRMMNGRKVSSDPLFIEPLGIALRQSTDILAINDPEIARAMRIIRERATLGLNVRQLMEQLPLSRRVFESRFQKRLGCTPHDMIVRIRMDRVRQLLRETDLPLETISHRCGFSHVEYLSAAFRKLTGVSPGAYRRRVRA